MPLIDATRRVLRDKVNIRVQRGFDPTTPGKASHNAAAKTNEGIRQGMAILLDSNGEFIKGTRALASAIAAATPDALNLIKGARVFIALHDDNEYDVLASGSMVGLDCSDQYQFQTGYFFGSGFSQGDLITLDNEGRFRIAGDPGTKVDPDSDSDVANSVASAAAGNATDHELVVAVVVAPEAPVGGFTPGAVDTEVLTLKSVQPYLITNA